MLFKEIKRVLIHIRFPLQSYTLLGFLFGLVVASVPFSYKLLIGFFSWFFLAAGVTVFNSYYDKDKGPVAGLKRPPSTKKSMLYGSIFFKAIGLVLAFYVNILFVSLYLFISILSILYSHKAFRFKSNGYVALLFNFIMGASTFIAATLLSTPNYKIVLSGSISAGTFLASIYLLMQIHQIKEDKKRKDISIAVMYGKKITLVVAIVLMILASILILLNFYFSGIKISIVLLLAIFFLVILFALLKWVKNISKSLNNFEIMNKITTYLSYVGNIILLVMYVLRIYFSPF